MVQLEQLPLWDVLEKKATDAQRAGIRELVEGAAAILDRVIETFPAYTLHNSTHAANVANLMAELLGPLPTDFRGEADLRFCAVLLRLADILDFDRTRSPEAVYEHLGLSRRIDPRQDTSDVEWRKHLCSEGFRFPDRRPEGYQLSFLAGPDEPGVEHDVR